MWFSVRNKPPFGQNLPGREDWSNAFLISPTVITASLMILSHVLFRSLSLKKKSTQHTSRCHSTVLDSCTVTIPLLLHPHSFHNFRSHSHSFSILQILGLKMQIPIRIKTSIHQYHLTLLTLNVGSTPVQLFDSTCRLHLSLRPAGSGPKYSNLSMFFLCS